MINILLILLILQIVKNLVTKKQSTVLSCGLLGFSGEYPANTDKLAILFMYNENRGIHSSGYYNHTTNIAPELRITKKGGKVSEKLLPNNAIKSNTLFIGHTRQATSGAGYTMPENAHPFLFGNWVAAHNGTLKNLDELLLSYGFNKEEIDIDSKVFAKTMETNNDFKILEQYDGAAALLWAKTNLIKQPILYAYHDKERPLFKGMIKVNDKIGLYFSSIEESLEAIGCEEIESLDENTVYKFINGSLKTTTVVDRTKPLINVNHIPNSLKRTCREKSRTYFSKGFDITEFNDSTINKIKYHNPTGFERKVSKEELLYDPKREITVHVKYYNDGGFEEVKVDGNSSKKTDDNTMSIDDVLDYVSGLYSVLDEIRAKLSDELDSKNLDDESLKELDDVQSNISTYLGSLVEINEPS